MSYQRRISHLPQLFQELALRLSSSKKLGSKQPVSVAATEHGIERRKAGYSAAMLVVESRMLQASIFQTLQNNLGNIDFSLLLIGVMTIADEIDSQLSQAMAGYHAEAFTEAFPASASRTTNNGSPNVRH